MTENSNRENASASSEKDETLATRVKDEGFWREMWHQIRLVWQLIRSPEVPLYLKLLPALALIYILIPTDFIPDVFPVIGQLDDITALLVGAKVFIELAPQDVVARQLQTMRSHQELTSASHSTNGLESPEEQIDQLIIIEGDFDAIEDEDENQAN